MNEAHLRERPDQSLAVRASQVTKIYGLDEFAVHALNGVDVNFETHTFTAIMGPSGSGKSTLLSCLAGLDTITTGSVWLAGAEVSSMRDAELTILRRDKLGFVFQSFNLMHALTAQWLVVAGPAIAAEDGDITTDVSFCPGDTVQVGDLVQGFRGNLLQLVAGGDGDIDLRGVADHGSFGVRPEGVAEYQRAGEESRTDQGREGGEQQATAVHSKTGQRHLEHGLTFQRLQSVEDVAGRRLRLSPTNLPSRWKTTRSA